MVKKYRTKVLADDEDSLRHDAHILRNAQLPASGSRVPGGDNSMVISKIQDASADLKYFI